MGKIDKWTLAAILVVAAIITVMIGKATKSAGTTAAALLAAGSAMVAWAAWSKAAVVENRYKGTIYVKTENGSDAVPVGPGQTPEGIDGIATPAGAGRVFKVHNGIFVWIDERGEVRPVSPLSGAINPGWVGRDYFDPSAREQWEPLFQKSGQKA